MLHKLIFYVWIRIMSPLCQMSMDKLPEWVLIGQRVGVVWQLWQCVHLRLYQLAFPRHMRGHLPLPLLRQWLIKLSYLC